VYIIYLTIVELHKNQEASFTLRQGASFLLLTFDLYVIIWK
jgi:hypothetical protein